jgi:hypothetical protein
MTKSTEFSLKRCIDDTVDTIRELANAVGWTKEKPAVDEETQDSLDFFLDTNNVLYFSTPISASVKSWDKSLLAAEETPFNAVISRDLASTYLGGDELVLVATIANKFKTMVIGAFDRTTGLGIVIEENWVDPQNLLAQIEASIQGGSYKWKVKEIVPSFFPENTPVGDRSKDRLLNLLRDCRKYTLSKVSNTDTSED